MKIFDFLNIQNYDKYLDSESFLTEQDIEIINYLKNKNKISKNYIPNVIKLLQKIKLIANENLKNLDDMINNLKYSKEILNNKIKEIKEDDTLKQLTIYNIDTEILSICANEFNKYYNRIIELQYRQHIISYKIIFLKEQKEKITDNIKMLDNYIYMLQQV